MENSEFEVFCKDINMLFSTYVQMEKKGNSSLVKNKIKKVIGEMLAYNNKEVCIDPAKLMRGKTHESYAGYFISEGVCKLELLEPLSEKGLSDEHIMPKEVVFNKMLEMKKEKKNEGFSNEEILFFSKLLSYSCIVTKEENDKLNKGKKNLKSAMPDNWSPKWPEDFSKEPDLQELQFFKRYEEAGIKCQVNDKQKDLLKNKSELKLIKFTQKDIPKRIRYDGKRNF